MMEEMEDFVIEDGVLKKYKGKGGDVVIPDGVTSIGNNAFCRCWELNSVTIPNSVTNIEDGAFSNCWKLTSVTIPDSVTSIEDHAFDGCESLTSVTIPDSVTSIGRDAFSCCENLPSLTYKGITFSLAKTDSTDSSEIIYMAVNRDFSVKMNHEVKYAVIWSVFRNTQEDEPANAYIKKNFAKMFPPLIDENDKETVKLVISSGMFLTKRNIDKFIQHAGKKRKKIASMLTEHKQQLEAQSKSKKK